MAQDEAISVRVDDGDSPQVPGRITGCRLLAACTDQLIDGFLIDETADVKHQEVFVGGAWRRLPVRVPDQLQVPGRLGPSQQQQGVAALGVGPGPVQHLQPESGNPEPLSSIEVTTGARDAGMARWQWTHAFSVPHAGRPSHSPIRERNSVKRPSTELLEQQLVSSQDPHAPWRTSGHQLPPTAR